MFESDGKGVPVLVRHYMKLGGKFLGFNVDHKFSNVLDGLLLVDLREAKPELLARYLGKEGAADFLRLHAGDAAKLCDETAKLCAEEAQ